VGFRWSFAGGGRATGISVTTPSESTYLARRGSSTALLRVTTYSCGIRVLLIPSSNIASANREPRRNFRKLVEPCTRLCNFLGGFICNGRGPITKKKGSRVGKEVKLHKPDMQGPKLNGIGKSLSHSQPSGVYLRSQLVTFLAHGLYELHYPS
jgi:hypothetical protein